MSAKDMAYLVLSSEGRELHRARLVEGQSMLLGREMHCDLSIKDAALSREHCRFEFHEDRWYVVDLDSRNGTLVNSHRINQRKKLRDEDVIRVGSVRLVFHAIGFIGVRPVDPFEAQIDSMLKDSGLAGAVQIPDWMPTPQPGTRRPARPAGDTTSPAAKSDDTKSAEPAPDKPRSGNWMSALIESVGSNLLGRRTRPTAPPQAKRAA
jgi:hypothetical protein